MQSYTAQTLLSELQNQGVILQAVEGGKLFIDGELSDDQFNAVKSLKPQIINAINSKQTFRFAENEYLFNDLKACLAVFANANDSAFRIIQYLVNYSETCKLKKNPGLCFNQPTTEAYISELNLIAGISKHRVKEINDHELRKFADIYIEKHREGISLADWLQEKDAPLFSIDLRLGGERLEYMIGNSVQVAFTSLYWQLVNSKITFEISRM